MPIIFTEKVLFDDSRSINWNSPPDEISESKRLILPLYSGEYSPSYTDITQGDIGSCWFLSALISYLRPNRKNLEKRRNDIKKSITLFLDSPNRKIYKVHLSKQFFYVDDFVPVSYHREKVNDINTSCIWFILLEKAMLSLMTVDNYFKEPGDRKANSIFLQEANVPHPTFWVRSIVTRCGEMKAATIGIDHLIGGRTQYYSLHPQDATSKIPFINSLGIYNKFKNGSHILANTARKTYPGKRLTSEVPVSSVGAVPSHCYALVDIKYCKDKKTYLLTMYNPWGKKELPDADGNYYYPEDVVSGKGVSIISWEKFSHCFACVHTSN